MLAPGEVGHLFSQPSLDINWWSLDSTTLTLLSVEKSLEHVQAGQCHRLHDCRAAMLFCSNKEEFDNRGRIMSSFSGLSRLAAPSSESEVLN